jgi:molybdopterin-containing oxidoreductase family membrane subunit
VQGLCRNASRTLQWLAGRISCAFINSNLVILFIISLLINVGMWFERFNIVGSSLQHEYDPSAWGEYWPTIVEVGITIGSFGFFFTLFTLFAKSLPPMAIMELKEASIPPMKRTEKGN